MPSFASTLSQSRTVTKRLFQGHMKISIAIRKTGYEDCISSLKGKRKISLIAAVLGPAIIFSLSFIWPGLTAMQNAINSLTLTLVINCLRLSLAEDRSCTDSALFSLHWLTSMYTAITIMNKGKDFRNVTRYSR